MLQPPGINWREKSEVGKLEYQDPALLAPQSARGLVLCEERCLSAFWLEGRGARNCVESQAVGLVSCLSILPLCLEILV